MSNSDIARILREIGMFLDMEDVPFKPRPYEKAAYAIVSTTPRRVMDFLLRMPEVTGVHGTGTTKGSVRLDIGMDLDVRVVPKESLGAALVYFTGSKAHNVALRRRAQTRGLKLNEYGVFRGRRRIAGRTEEDVYAALDLPNVPPELREDQGEIEAAEAGTLPRLIDHADLRGDLRTQTSWTDGANTIEEKGADPRARRQITRRRRRPSG